MKVYLRDLAFSSAREVEVTTNKKAIIIMVRFPLHSPQAARPSCAAGQDFVQELRLDTAPLLFSWG